MHGGSWLRGSREHGGLLLRLLPAVAPGLEQCSRVSQLGAAVSGGCISLPFFICFFFRGVHCALRRNRGCPVLGLFRAGPHLEARDMFGGHRV